jgi:hypothetical protein
MKSTADIKWILIHFVLRTRDAVMYEVVSKSFRTGRLERELQMVEFSATRSSCIAILCVNLVNCAAFTLCVASQRVFIVVSVYFVINSVRKLLDTPSYSSYNDTNLLRGENTAWGGHLFPAFASTCSLTGPEPWEDRFRVHRPQWLKFHLQETARSTPHVMTVSASDASNMTHARDIRRAECMWNLSPCYHCAECTWTLSPRYSTRSVPDKLTRVANIHADFLAMHKRNKMPWYTYYHTELSKTGYIIS